MSALEWGLLAAIAVLAALVLTALILGARALRRLGVTGTGPATDDSAFVAEKDRQEQSLAALRSAADEAYTTVDAAKSAAAAARAEAAAAKAEASAARAEARRVLDAARVEADTVLERAHRQAEDDAEQVRTAARRSGEREIALLDRHHQGAGRRGRAAGRSGWTSGSGCTPRRSSGWPSGNAG